MFRIRKLHQIEITSRCNLACKYCPSPKLGRPKVDMTEEHWQASLRWAAHFVGYGQAELNLCGIGESTLHDRFEQWMYEARAAVGDRCRLVLTTNGVWGDMEPKVRALRLNRVDTFVSLHRPERAARVVNALREAGVLAGVSMDPATASINWAGQVDWPVTVPVERQCMWVREGRVMVMADGRVTRCCMDASGVGVIGSIEDDLTKMETSPYILCRTCDQDVGVAMTEEAA